MLSIEGSPPTKKELTDRYAKTFENNLGNMKSFRAHLSLKDGATPRFHCPHPVRFAIKDSVGCELDSLEEAGILHKIYILQWLGCITCPCPGRTLLLRDDYKVTINLVLQVDQYPLPNPTELLVSLTSGKWLTKLDLTSAYQQMLLDGESTKSVTIKMHQGLYEYTRLSFDVASALAVF